MTRRPLRERMFKLLLRLFPLEFRGDFGREMSADFEDQQAAAATSRRSIAGLWVRTITDVLRRAPAEHFDILRRDASYAMRLLRRRRASTAVVVLTMAMGIGLSTAVFSVVKGVLLRGLPLPQSDRIVRIYEVDPEAPTQLGSTSGPNFTDWQTRTRTLDVIAASTAWPDTVISIGNDPERVEALVVTDGFFRVVGVQPALGRTFTSDEYRHAGSMVGPGPGVAVLSHALWVRLFAGRPDVVGGTFRFGRHTLRIVGVMPAGLETEGVGRVDTPALWLPGTPDQPSRRARFVSTVGRLAPGISLKQAQSEFQGIAAALAAAYPSANKGWSIRVLPALDQVVSDVRPQLWLLAAAAFCLLLIAAANVTSLLLTQAVGRRSELATRSAMGASRADLARQLVTEGIVLAALSGLIGILVAYWTVPMLVAQAPSSIPRLRGVSVDVGVLLFAVGLTMTWALLCGLGLAAWVHPSRLAPAFALRSGDAAGRAGRIRHSLAVGQVALAMVLVVAAGLLVRTTQSLGAVRLGFDPRNVVAVDLNPRNFRQAARFQADFVDQVRSLPGVMAVGSGRRPLTGGPMNLVRLAVDRPGEPIGLEAVSPGYMAALRMPIVRGRVFDAADQTAGRVAIVNESAARHLWGDLDPVGRSVFIDDPPREASVVGVVTDVIKRGLERPYEPIVYVLPLQETSVFYPTVLVRASGDPRGLVPAVSAVLRRMDPEQPLTKVDTLDDILSDAMAPRRFLLDLVGLFSALALGLSMLGIYGVLSETVAQRVPELGVRVALGATRSRIVTMILSQGLSIVGIGIALGVAGAFASRQLMTTLVFGVTPADRATYALASIGVLVAALLACWIPARRAATIDPVVALRHE